MKRCTGALKAFSKARNLRAQVRIAVIIIQCRARGWFGRERVEQILIAREVPLLSADLALGGVCD